MYIMYCTNCGSQIPDDSKFCTICGNQMENKTSQKAKVTFRRKNDISGFMLDTEIFIDGKHIGNVSNGASFDTELEIGEHKVTLSMISGTNEEMIEITPDKPNLVIDIQFKKTFFTAKMSIVNIERN